ncbi:hypothetical protein [Winogradskyella sp. PC D3.3]
MELTKQTIETIKQEWNTLGHKYATDVNAMVEFGDTNGWENWKGEEPKDERDHLADAVYELLKAANKNDTVAEFRTNFPPAHGPLVKFMQEKGQSIEQLHHIEDQKIVFVVGTAYQKRQAYILKADEVIALDTTINVIGKSKQHNVFAIISNNTIVTTQGWEGAVIATFKLDKAKNLGISELIPFNDGLKVLLVTSEGIFIISSEGEKMIHPIEDLEDDEWEPYMDMQNGTLSNDNRYIVVGDQCCDHRILDANGDEIGQIGAQSSYPDFCLFSKDDQQLITNSCHFYNGVTIGVDTSNVKGLHITAYEESDYYTTIDDGMRVYCGVATSKYYILGDAYGYIKAIDTQGHCFWKYFLGSTITGITISEDESTLWVGSASGMLHKLQLDKGLRDNHTIGTGKHYEDFRLVLWKDEPIMKW